MLIVGAGAAGTMLTLELARRGVRVRTVDRLPKPADTSRAITVHARTMEIFERIDKRLIERYLDRGIHNKGYVLHFVDADAQAQRSAARHRLHEARLSLSLHPRESAERDRACTCASTRARTTAYRPTGTRTCVDVKQDADGVTATLDVGGSAGTGALRLPRRVRRPELASCARRIGLEQKESDYAGTRAPEPRRAPERLSRRRRVHALLRRHRSLHHDREAAGWLLPHAAATAARLRVCRQRMASCASSTSTSTA